MTRSTVGSGAVVELLIGVNEARREVLLRSGFPVPARVRVLAQIDTGTEFSAVDSSILARLDVRPIDSILVRTPDTTTEPRAFQQYAVSIALASDTLEMFLTSVEVLGCAFAPDEGIQAMLGRDVLEHCLFFYDGPRRTFSLAF
jgi:hypothetical protein